MHACNPNIGREVRGEIEWKQTNPRLAGSVNSKFSELKRKTDHDYIVHLPQPLAYTQIETQRDTHSGGWRGWVWRGSPRAHLDHRLLFLILFSNQINQYGVGDMAQLAKCHPYKSMKTQVQIPSTHEKQEGTVKGICNYSACGRETTGRSCMLAASKPTQSLGSRLS